MPQGPRPAGESWNDWGRLVLGLEARVHLKGRLGIGEEASGLPLSNALRSLPLDEGEVWTWTPPGTSITARDLRNGLPSRLVNRVSRRGLLNSSSSTWDPGAGWHW